MNFKHTPIIRCASSPAAGALAFAWLFIYATAATMAQQPGHHQQPAAMSPDGFVSLFDGRALKGWKAVPPESATDWTVKDGRIVGQGTADRLSYLVWEGRELTDFELQLQYRLPGEGNTGIEIRSRPDPSGKRPLEGYHADLGHVGIGPHILGAWDFHFAKRQEYPCPRGSRLVIEADGQSRSEPIADSLTANDVRPRDWNQVRIVARGNQFQFFINGKLASEFTDNAATGRLERGVIGLQIHDKDMRVEFKDIRLKALDSRPNIILVFIDDMGWSDLSCFGGTHVQTENIDRLAEEGIRFEQFYVNSPICSPSRTAISTGQYPQRWKITSFLSNRDHNRRRGMAQWLDPQAPMLARSLQQAGYATGHFGKWHMGGQRDVDDAPPITDYGFDESLTNFEGMGNKLLPLVQRPGDQAPGKIWKDAERLGSGYRWMPRSEITGGFVDAAIPFMDQAKRVKQPFYINLWPDDVHSPFWPPLDKWPDEPGKPALYHAVLQAMDRQLGRLFDFVRDDPWLRENTLILVCSDNGPEAGAGSAGPLRGYKTHLYEGGVRSALVAWGPGILHRQNHVDRTSVFSAIDLVPTVLELTNTTVSEDVTFDGESLPEILLGHGGSRAAPIFFRRPPDRDAFYGDPDLPDLAMRFENWKFLCEYDGAQPELYDLETDVGESTNLAHQQAELTAELAEALIGWHQSMPADQGDSYRPQPRKKSKQK